MYFSVRKEGDGIRRYVHLSTGNYNPVTAQLYTDIGLFTCDEAIATDVADMFNFLTGYARRQSIHDFMLYGADEYLAKPFQVHGYANRGGANTGP